MNCQEVQHHLSPLLDNELSIDVTASVMHHLDSCVSCQTDWTAENQLRATLLQSISSIAAPSNLVERIQRAVEDDRKFSNRLRSRFNPRLAMVAASIAALGVGYSVLSGNFKQGTTQAELSGNPGALVADYSGKALTTEQHKSLVAMRELQQNLGFAPVNPPGWTFVRAEMCSIDKTPALHLSYVNEKRQTMSCYQVKHGLFDAKGLAKHDMKGRVFCCGKVNNVSVVYCPSEKGDNILVSALPEPMLMAIAMKT